MEILIDTPSENYQRGRFDWTGKIIAVKFQNISLTTIENPKDPHLSELGRGFYNEFGIDKALGFEETEIGGWFHKIGIGLLKKTEADYHFNKNYEIRPAEFQLEADKDKVLITCKAKNNGYAYVLRKTIALQKSGFSIQYDLQNTGEKVIETDEYVHNFIAINEAPIGENYRLEFPFELKPHCFGETVNTENKVVIAQKKVSFSGRPFQPFFFSNLCGDKKVKAEWALFHLDHQIVLREKTNFQTSKINLWGWEHVISPELFFSISLNPGQSVRWKREYEISRTTES